jgi:hypothetical protein
MLMTNEDRRQLAIAAAEQALAGLQHLSPTRMVAEVGGRRVEVTLRGAQMRTDTPDPNRILELRFPLAVPIKLGINQRSNYLHVGPVPIVTTGDPAFDAAFVVPGVPNEVVQRALDAPTRAWMQHYGQVHLMLHTDEWGALSFSHSISPPRENPRQPLTPELISDAATALSHFANSLEACYRARRAEIVAHQGESGALAWETQNEKLVKARPLGWLRWAYFGCMALALLVVVSTTAVFVIWMITATR